MLHHNNEFKLCVKYFTQIYIASATQQWAGYFLGHGELGGDRTVCNSWICLSFAGCRLE